MIPVTLAKVPYPKHDTALSVHPFCMKEHADAGMRAQIAIIGNR